MESRKYHVDANVLISSVVADLKEFHGQEVYKDIGKAVADRNGKARFVMRAVESGAHFLVVNFFLVLGVVIFFRFFRIPDREGDIFQYGPSRNNEVAFEKLNACLVGYKNVRIVTNGRPPVFGEILRALFSIKLVYFSAKVLSSRPHDNPFVHLQSAIGAAACVFFSANPLPASFRILCVANDHAPAPRALLKLCRAKGLKTLYVQHAPVTEYFPALCTDLSILYDEKSVEAYRKASVSKGEPFTSEVVLMPPFSDSFLAPGGKEVNEVRVGVCLSKFPDLERLVNVLTVLCSSRTVASVVLRPHPACKLDLSTLLIDEKIIIQREGAGLDEFVQGLGLALVPTSGVAIELLHKGVPTFYTPKMDDVPYDYYGFVYDGVLPVFDIEKFTEKGVDIEFFDEAWKERFAGYDVTVNKSVQECRHEVAEAFTKLL